MNEYTVPELKKIIRATNISGYSKLGKEGLIKLMMRPEHKERFKDIRPKSERMGGAGAKVNREFRKRAKRPRELFELKQQSKELQKKIDKMEKK